LRKTLHVEHLRPLFAFLGQRLSEQELQSVLGLLDANNDGVVDCDDFVRVMLGNSANFDVDRAVSAPFAALDQDGDGRIGRDDLLAAGRAIGRVFGCTSEFEAATITRHFSEVPVSSETHAPPGVAAPVEAGKRPDAGKLATRAAAAAQAARTEWAISRQAFEEIARGAANLERIELANAMLSFVEAESSD
jgi:hypothetical protein